MKWNELRAVLFINRECEGGLGTIIQVVKVGLSGTCESSDKQSHKTRADCDSVGRQLEACGFIQRGCFVGDDGVGYNRAWATAWLKPGDEPELLSEAMGQRIVPATLMWHFTTGNTPGHIYSSLSASHIRRARARNPSESDDLAVRESPTLEQRLRAHGL
jgi:hypothetical protein